MAIAVGVLWVIFAFFGWMAMHPTRRRAKVRSAHVASLISVHKSVLFCTEWRVMMKTVTLTEFRSHASSMLTLVENGETLRILRHGRPIADISPVREETDSQPSWKSPALRLTTEGPGLSSAIVEERSEDLS
jgi:antitoxin (DNA-binding transcriptional repressor) of toxin-antitoxin stability system